MQIKSERVQKTMKNQKGKKSKGVVKVKSKKSLLFKIAVSVFFIYVAFLVIQLQVDIIIKKQQLNEVQAKCAQQEQVNEEYRRILAASDTDEYLERMAREKLGYVYPDERVFFDVS